MLVKVLIKRKIKEGKTREVFALLNKFRRDAMNQKGYISGETFFSYDDPQELLVISTWQSVDNWLKWKENPDRIANENIMKQLLEESPVHEIYIYGTYYTQFKKTEH